jgi:hypothetical protein
MRQQGAEELQRDDGDQEHPDEGMHRQQRPELQQRRPLDGQQQQEDRRHHRGQLTIAGAPAYEQTLDPTHAGTQADLPEKRLRGSGIRRRLPERPRLVGLPHLSSRI